MMMRLWSLWAKGRAVDKSRLFCDLSTASAPVRWRFFASELSTKSTALFFAFGAAARPPLGTSSPYGSKERRADFSRRTRTVAWANKPAFLQGWVMR